MKYLIYTVILVTCTTNSKAQINNTCCLRETVELSGIIKRASFRSKMIGERKERINPTCFISLEKPVTVVNNRNDEERYKDVSLIEITNLFKHKVNTFQGRKVVVKGVLYTASRQERYPRTYATPIFMDVESIRLANND